MEQAAENIDTVSPGGSLPETKKLRKLLDEIVSSCGDIQKALPAVLPVAQVRRIEAWAAMTSAGDHKTVIIDGADRMPEGSRNALLKFLEEPPSDTTVILITDRKGLIIPTVLSRLRDYPFRRRRPVEEAAILEKVFKEDEGRWGGLNEFFMAWRTGPVERLREMASRFIDGARKGEKAIPDEAKKIQDAVDFASFLEALTLELRKRWHEGAVPSPRRAAEEAEILRQARIRAENLYITPSLLIRGLYASLGARSPVAGTFGGGISGNRPPGGSG
jgi:DNA polymerase-3 subunit gamma/tau